MEKTYPVYKITDEPIIVVVGICVECFADITSDDEMLPDYPRLYQCPECGHPNGPY